MTGPSERAVTITAGDVQMEADLTLPPGASGLVIFCHGSGSSRHSPRNREVARALVARGLSTLLMDLLTPEEEQVDLRTRHLRFDIDMLAVRVVHAIQWSRREPDLRTLPLGLFGSSTGAAAALLAAAHEPGTVAAIVSRGGRPDLAGPALRSVRAPTLLIVGGYDGQVIDLNRSAQRALPESTRLEIVEGATHLFEEPGALDRVARLAGDWFLEHLRPGAI
jgi:dienelactone hydrolase